MTNIYYLDEPLNRDEFEHVKSVMAELEGLKYIQGIKQIRVATVLPSEHKIIETEEELNSELKFLTKSLLACGLKKEQGNQVVWVMPKNTVWGLRYSLAIEKITGYMPYTAKRWKWVGEEQVREEIHVLDNHGLMYGK